MASFQEIQEMIQMDRTKREEGFLSLDIEAFWGIRTEEIHIQ
jgi:hypothetical protein